MSARLRLVVDNALPEKDVRALKMIEEVTRFRLCADGLRGPGKAGLDADVRLLRAVALRLATSET